MKIVGRVWVCAVLVTAPVEAAAADALAQAAACRHSPKVVSACFTVRGRLSVANGTPSFRIWLVGTRRVIGVVAADGDAEVAVLPPAVESRVVHGDEPRAMMGAYTLCPLSPRRPGRMQLACMAGARDLSTLPGTSP